MKKSTHGYFRKRSNRQKLLGKSQYIKNDEKFKDFGDLAVGNELKYNKFYIGLSKEGLVKNFIEIKQKKNYFYLIVKGTESSEKIY